MWQIAGLIIFLEDRKTEKKELGYFNANFKNVELFLWFKLRRAHNCGLFIKKITFLEYFGMVATLKKALGNFNVNFKN